MHYGDNKMPNITIYLDADTYLKFMKLESEGQRKIRDKLTSTIKKEVI